MLKLIKIQVPDDTSILDLSNKSFDDEREELEVIDAKQPSKFDKLLLKQTKIGPSSSQKLFKHLESYNFERMISISSNVSNLALHFAKNTTWTRLKLIQLDDIGLKDEAIIEISKNSTWTELQVLSLSKNLIGNLGAIGLALNNTWRKLRKIDLSYNKIEHDGAMGLAKNNTWSELIELDLQFNSLGDESSFALGRNEAWKNLQLRFLVKGNPDISPARKLVFSINCKTWTRFNKELEEMKEKDVEVLIDENEIHFKRDFKKLLADCRDERKEDLDRIWNDREKYASVSLDDNGIENIDKQGHLMWTPKLELLKLSGFVIKIEGAGLISKTMCWRRLKQVDLSRTRLQDQGIAIIAKNTIWTHLRSLDVSNNSISDEGCLSLAQNSSWKLLQSLNLAYNSITIKGSVYLSQNSAWTQIEEINLNSNLSDQMIGLDYLAGNKNWKCLQRVLLFGSRSPIDELVSFFEKHDTLALPRIEIEVSKYMQSLNLKYLYRFSKLKECEDFGAKVNEINEEFHQEINQIAIQSSEAKTWKTLIAYRQKKKIDHCLLIREGFTLENVNLIWFPEAKTIDLSDYKRKKHFESWEKDAAIGNMIADAIVALSQNPLLWINLENLNLDSKFLTDLHLSKFTNMRNFRNLRKLSLSSNAITDEGALYLAKNEHWRGLEVLNLRGNMIRKYKTVLSLAENKNWPNFKLLQISCHLIPKEKCSALRSHLKTKILFFESQ